MLDAGLPAGVLNVVSSASASGISGPLLQDPRLRKVSFTGSTPVGKRLMADAAQNVLRTSMELGGNAPFIVFEDADLDKAVEGAMAAKMRNMGEACTAANRFLVQESVAAEFTAKFAAAMGALATGRGTEPATQVGPLIDAGARDDVHALVSAAVDAGATAVTGGAPGGGAGYFYPPTVLANVPNDAAILRPGDLRTRRPGHHVRHRGGRHPAGQRQRIRPGLLPLQPRLQPAAPRGRTDRVRHGGLQRRRHLQRRGPFGGVKQSGLGREGGSEGIAEYTTTQYIGIADPYAS